MLSIAARDTVTYTFTQTAWGIDGSPAPSFSETGSFTGTPEIDGYIEQADLSSFSATFSHLGNPLASFSLADLQYFSFLTGQSGSFGFYASQQYYSLTFKLCSGAPAAYGYCGQGGNIQGEYYPYYSSYVTTADPAALTLLPNPPPPPAVPESSGLVLVAMGVMAAGILRGTHTGSATRLNV